MIFYVILKPAMDTYYALSGLYDQGAAIASGFTGGY